MSYEALMALHQLSSVPLPTIIEVISEEEYRRRASRKGARTCYELYGNPGTPEGRRKGGQRGLGELRRRVKAHPELYPNFKSKKEILTPEKSPMLAELVGILLGDGEIADLQDEVKRYLAEIGTKPPSLETFPSFRRGVLGRGFRSHHIGRRLGQKKPPTRSVAEA
ncbi:MAG TPA: hypothetical protein EYP49_17265 [Anaerolineae bacterium]|nr:hypothetical protein [Anaerolineae bacterium]